MSVFEHMQNLLTEAGLDAWLIYDFQGINPFAKQLLSIPSHIHLSRRFFVYIPARGQAVIIHNSIESGNWGIINAHLGAELRAVNGHHDLQQRLGELLKPESKIAMEYHPLVPYVSRVDAGTIEKIRAFGVNIVPSADLLQHFLSYTPEDLAAHYRAVDVLMHAKDRAFDFIREQLRHNQPVNEVSVQHVVMNSIHNAGLYADHDAIVGFAAHAADPHYSPTPEKNAVLQTGDCILIDLWAQEQGKPHADVTWMGIHGTPSPIMQQAWDTVKTARDTAIDNIRAGKQGWEIDHASREIIVGAGFAEYFTHRLGHSLGVNIHAAGANLDDLETRDTRLLLPNMMVTVEPGIYMPQDNFGVRTEVNVYIQKGGNIVTTPVQHDWIQVLP